MEQIYHSKHFGQIDLAKIFLITDAELSGGGRYVGFSVHIVGQESALAYVRPLKSEVESRFVSVQHSDGGNPSNYWEIRTDRGEWKRNIKINIDNDYTAAEYNLQDEINVLVNAWKWYCLGAAVSKLPQQNHIPGTD